MTDNAAPTPNTSSSPKPPTIDRLLQLVPDSPSTVLTHLSAYPRLAHLADANGYTLAHAASSYAHLDLLRTLINTYSFKINTPDIDGDTPLFAAETVPVARCLIEELRADASRRNYEGETAEEKIDADGDFPLVAAYLRSVVNGASDTKTATVVSSANAAEDGTDNGEQLRRPAPLPPGMSLDISTTTKTLGNGESNSQGEVETEPDPEFRARIEALALRDDFAAESGQNELRGLVRDAVRGLAAEGNERNVRDFVSPLSRSGGTGEAGGEPPTQSSEDLSKGAPSS